MHEARRRLSPRDALIVVDVQNDFCPGGALPVPEGDRVVPLLNEWIAAATDAGAVVAASRDRHPRGHVSFEERGGDWPPHCIRGTAGERFHPDLKLPEDVLLVDKGTEVEGDAYSAFDGTGLADDLKRRGVDTVWVGGLAQDVCVRATVLDALAAGFETHLIAEATRPVDSDKGRDALDEMRHAGAIIEGDDGNG